MKWMDAPAVDEPKWASAPVAKSRADELMERALAAPTEAEYRKLMAEANAAAVEDGQTPAGVVFNPKTGGLTDIGLRKDKGRASAALQGAGQGASFGTMDEVVAGLYGLTGPGTFQQNRDYSLASMRGDLASARENYPVTTFAGEIAGGVAATAPFAVGATGVKEAAKAGAKIGGVTGAAYSAGSAEGNIGERLDDAVYGGILGAGLGYAVPYVAKGAGKAWQAGKRAVADRRIASEAGKAAGSDKATGGLLARILEMDDAQRMRDALARGGDDAMLADAGPTTQGVLDAVIQSPGEGARIAQRRIDDRATRAGQRIASALDDTLGTPDGIITTQQGIRSSTAAARRSAYDDAFANEIDWRSPAGAHLRGLLETTPDDVLRNADALRRMSARPKGIPESAYPEAQIATRQGPGFWTEAADMAERKQVDDFFAAYSAARPEAGMKRPLTNAIRKAGGIDPNSPAAAELYHLGVNPRTTPGLFRRGGMKDLDNLPLGELADTLRFSADDGTGNYASRDAIFQALRGELDGTPVSNAPDMPAGYIDELERMLPEYEARRAALAGPNMPPDPGPVSDIVPMKTVGDIDQIKRALDDVARKETDISGKITDYGMSARNRATALRDALIEAAPGYDDALALGKDTIRRTEAVETGAKLLSPSTTKEKAAMALKGMTEAERSAVKQGVRSRIQDTLDNVRAVPSDPNIDARQAVKAWSDLTTPAAKAKMKMLLGDEWAKLEPALDQAGQALGLRARTAANSRTSSRLSTDAMLKDMSDPGAFRSGDWIDGWSTFTAPVKGAWKATARATPAAVQKSSARTRANLAEILTRPGSTGLLDAIEAIRMQNTVPADSGALIEYLGRIGMLGGVGASSQGLLGQLR